MNKENKKVHTPLFTTFKRFDMPKWQGILIRVGAIAISIIISLIIAMIVCQGKPIDIAKFFFEGATIRPWKLFLDAAILLGFGMAILPAFKMRYWNMGANGQVLVGSLVSIIIMFYLKDFGMKSGFNNFLLLVFMFAGSLLASIIWAVIPAIFKTFFGTNETLFTLMMNYIASALVAYVNYVLAKGAKESPGVINMDTQTGWLHSPINEYFIPIVVIILVAVFIHIYMTKTKHGYEAIVLGDSINTARYVGMNTKKIMIRTLILSGAICGIIGFLFTSVINHSINTTTCGSLGFTAVLIAWLSNFNPLIMALVSFALAFLTLGTSKITASYQLGSNNLSSVIIGLIFFSILISEFFIRYKVKINIKRKEKEEPQKVEKVEPQEIETVKEEVK
ncbi:ABC transporter permease [bacterium]|nr:ABC transporter permease [bacterium]